MAQQLMEFGVGISLDNAVQIIYGTGVPGNTEDTNAAKVGSSYSDVETGAKWQKIADTTGPTAWVELAGKDAAIMVQHIASTGVILDQVPTQLATEFAWMVTAFNEADPTNKYSALVHMSHNGTATSDATNVTYDQSSILRQGAKITGLQLTATLTGQGANQYMNLHVSSGAMVTFIAYRMVKNVAGSNTVILGGANLANHIADGSVHLQVWQNTLLDGLSQSLNSTQVNQLIGVTAPIQTQLDAKAATLSLATVATSGSYSDLSNKPTIPTLVSQLSNDSQYVTFTDMYTELAGHTQTIATVTGLQGQLDGINTSLSAKATTSYVDSGLATKSALVHAHTAVTTSANGYMIAADKVKLDGLSSYTLPTAAAGTLGGVKVGSGLSIDGAGVLSASGAVSSVAGRTGAVTISGADLTSWAGAPYDIAFPVFGAPANGEVVFRFKTPRAFSIPANFAGGFAVATTAGTGATTWSIQKNGAQVATVAFSAAGTTGTFSTQAAISFAAGDKLTVVAPATADATLADVDFTFVATLS